MELPTLVFPFRTFGRQLLPVPRPGAAQADRVPMCAAQQTSCDVSACVCHPLCRGPGKTCPAAPSPLSRVHTRRGAGTLPHGPLRAPVAPKGDGARRAGEGVRGESAGALTVLVPASSEPASAEPRTLSAPCAERPAGGLTASRTPASGGASPGPTFSPATRCPPPRCSRRAGIEKPRLGSTDESL